MLKTEESGPVVLANGRKPVLDRCSFPMRLWKKAKRYGVWNPDDIDFIPDREAWCNLPDDRQQCILQLCALFFAGEKAVTRDLLPLLHLVASEGREDEEIYLTSFLWEEAKHVDLFSRFLEQVCDSPADLSPYYRHSQRLLLEDELQSALKRLYLDTSVEAQVRASVTYNMVVEGIMADTGYHIFHRLLKNHIPLPGMQKAVTYLQRDESRHIAFGVYFLSRLIIEHGSPAYKAFLDRMLELKPLVESSTLEFTQCFERDPALGIRADDLMRFSSRRFAARVQTIMRARTRTLDELHRSSYLAGRA